MPGQLLPQRKLMQGLRLYRCIMLPHHYRQLQSLQERLGVRLVHDGVLPFQLEPNMQSLRGNLAELPYLLQRDDLHTLQHDLLYQRSEPVYLLQQLDQPVHHLLQQHVLHFLPTALHHGQRVLPQLPHLAHE